MVVILVNNRQIDIDEQTAVGLSIATYDVTKPATPLVTISNKFSIPKTANNLAAIGFAGSSYYFSSLPYEPLYITIYVDGDILLFNAKARVETIGSRIELLIYQKYEAFDRMKVDKVINYTNDLLQFVGAHRQANKFAGTFTSFIAQYLNNNNGIIIPYTFSTFYPDIEAIGTQVYKSNDTTTTECYGAHCFIFAKDFLKFVENKYSIDFHNGDNFLGNFFKDEYFASAIIFLPFLIIKNDSGFYFAAADEHNKIKDNSQAGSDLTFYSIFEAIVKMFNVCIDNNIDEGLNSYYLYRYDRISEFAPLKDFSGNISKIVEFSPIIENIKQTNIIKYKAVPEGFSETYAGRTIECKNKNIEAKGTLIEIPAFAFGFVNDNGINIPNLSNSEAYSNPVIAILSVAKLSVLAKYETNEVNVKCYIPVLYDLSNEYNILQIIYEYPQVFVIEKWLTLNDLKTFRNFATYYVDLFGCSFIVSKIDNYNAVKRQPTKITLVKVSDKTITTPAQSHFFVDAVGNIFSDSVGQGFGYSSN